MGAYDGPTKSVQDVVHAMKKDVNAAQDYLLWAGIQPALSNTCQGLVQFELINIRVTLSTIAARTGSGSVGATVPVGGGVTLGPSAAFERVATDTQIVSFAVYPTPLKFDPKKRPTEEPAKTQYEAMEAAILLSAESMGDAPSPAEVKRLQALVAKFAEPPIREPAAYPILEGLRSLRNGLLAASDEKYCFNMAHDKDDKPNTLEYSFVVDDKLTSGGEIKFLVFAAKAGSIQQNKGTNSVVVNFRATGKSIAVIPMEKG